MIQILKKLFGMEPTIDLKQMVKEGATIVDVRSAGEYNSGHIKGSINIPVDQLRNHLNKISNKEKTIITCCASGMRSASAKSILKSSGYTDVHNGGGWSSLQLKIM